MPYFNYLYHTFAIFTQFGIFHQIHKRKKISKYKKDNNSYVCERTFPDPISWYLFSRSFSTGSSVMYVTKQKPRLSFVLVSVGSSMFSIF